MPGECPEKTGYEEADGDHREGESIVFRTNPILQKGSVGRIFFCAWKTA